MECSWFRVRRWYCSFRSKSCNCLHMAVEEVIDEHYADQAAQLTEDEGELKETINRFRDEELEHRDTAIDLADNAWLSCFGRTIRAGSKLALYCRAPVNALISSSSSLSQYKVPPAFMQMIWWKGTPVFLQL